MIHPKKLQKIFEKTLRKKHIHGAVVQITQGNQSWENAGGNLNLQSNYFIASTSKLFVTAIMLQLRQEGKIQLDEPAIKFLPAAIMNRIHVIDGQDFSENITLRHLMAHTSGLPDYFEDKFPDGSSLLDKVKQGIDTGWTAAETIEFSKQMPPHFAPGTKGKAHYSDTNYQLLGLIIENVLSQKLEKVFQHRIIEALGLQNTWLYTEPEDKRPVDIYFKDLKMHVPKTMASFRADGGIVSTASDSMIFIQSFFDGKLFMPDYLPELYQWKRVMFPLEYGVGIMRFKLPRLFSPFRKMPELIGHSGLSGAFAFYAPSKNCYLSGTVNQLSNPGTSFRFMLQCLDAIS